MKILLLSLTLLSTFAAHAVVVKNCPKQFTITYSGISGASDKVLQQSVSDDFVSLKEERELFLKSMFPLILSYDLKGSLLSGVCEYDVIEPNGTFQYARMKTEKGRDMLRTEIELDNDLVVWVYHTITSYGPEQIELKEKDYTRVKGGQCNSTGGCWSTIGYLNNPKVEKE